MFGWFKKSAKSTKRRSFDAAKFNRLVSSWLSVSQSINKDLKDGLDNLRIRSRDLAQNEPMAAKYLSLVSANVIGARGIVLQARVTEDNGNQDKYANIAIEKAWYDWGKKYCDISGRLSLNDMERLLVECVARDGEALILEHQSADNPHGYNLQVIDAERLATSLDRKAENGKNAILMGVEIDAKGKPVAYHLKKNVDVVVGDTERYPAEKIIHLFMAKTPEQVRGYPWAHSVMVRMFHLKKYQEFALVASAVGASKMGFFKQPEGDGSQLADDEDQETGELFQEAAAGQFGVLPEGVDFVPFNPDYPHQMYAEFIKTAKRDISSGLNVSYHSLANDLEGVNFSSIRSGTLEEREQWMVAQDWFINAFMERIYSNWLKNALLKGAIVTPNGKSMPASKIAKFSEHEFLGRRWQWVDPLKDVKANIEAMNAGLMSPYVIAAQQGSDAEEIIDDIARFQTYVTDKGVVLQSPKNDNQPISDVTN
jgi:lambda family phage portal protein